MIRRRSALVWFLGLVEGGMMFSSKRWYAIHRWIALVISLQLLAWSVGGLVFSLLDIEEVRGNLDRVETASVPLEVARVRLSPSEAVARVAEGGVDVGGVVRVVLQTRLDRTVYELHDAERRPIGVVDAETGTVTTRISEDRAVEIALADFAPGASGASVTWLEGEAPLEYRGKPMPVYRVVLDHPKQPHIYVSPVTGAVAARRNGRWRLFDFFWMLHVMDYRERDDFNHPLLTVASVLAVLTSLSGLCLWCGRLTRRRANRRSRAVALQAS